MNPEIDNLHSYPFEKLGTLKRDLKAPDGLSHIALSIGEPKHLPPPFLLKLLTESLDGISTYPATRGLSELRQAIADWLCRRFGLDTSTLDIDRQVLPVNGTREALFAFAQATIDRANHPLVVMPNPFYQIYEGAALLAGAEPYYLNCDADTDFIPDFDAISPDIWRRCQLLFICSPGNPTGAVMDSNQMQKLIELADRYDFVIASDECYSEIYHDESNPPAGLLQACTEMNRDDYRRCVVFHSLSKRSNLPGMRSGFVAGDASILKYFFKYRTYHGSAMPPHHQRASIAAWKDEDHVVANRALYRDKFAAVLEILDRRLNLVRPSAGFYLWPEVPGGDERFTRELFASQNVTVLPGSYLARERGGVNPGATRVRMALVAPLTECREAAERIANFLTSRPC